MSLDELGYNAEWQVLNSKHFGVPQNRERMFIIGHLRGTSGRKIFPIFGTTAKNYKVIGTTKNKEAKGTNSRSWVYDITKIMSCLSATDYKQPKQIADYRNDEGLRIRKEQIAPCLSARKHSETDISTMPSLVIPVLTPDRVNKRQNGRRFKENGDPSFTITSQDRHGIYDSQKIRRLTPTECERLQGFPELESFINFNIQSDYICLDLQKSYVDVEIKNHRLQKLVGYVEENKKKETVLSVEQDLNINNQQINKLVQENVLISCVGEKIHIHNPKKSSSFVNYVENLNLFHYHIKEEDFVQILAGINTTLKNVIIHGKEGSLQNEQYLIQVQNGKLFVKQFGKEMMPLVKDVKIDLIILKKHLKYITLNHLNLKKIDSNWIISFLYVINAIIGFIQIETNVRNLFLRIYNRYGWTENGISDTQRYKCLGNAVTVNVIKVIFKKIIEEQIK